nr:MAG TPA: hypothetical protein [Bacteriophage sp.]
MIKDCLPILLLRSSIRMEILEPLGKLLIRIPI